MKLLSTILILLLHVTLTAQTEQAAGDYQLSTGTATKDNFNYQLTLNADGTFIFQYFSNTKFDIPNEKSYYGRGSWTLKNNIVSFTTDKKKDIDEKYTLDFSNSKARLIAKSPKDTSDRIIEPKLQFLKSEVSWMSRILLLKV